MSALTDYAESQIRAHIFRTATFTKPTVLAIALFTATPGEAGGGTEVTGGSYARVQRDPLDANWSAASGTDGLTDNVASLDFPTATASWGTVTSFGIFDATTVGNLLVYGALGASKLVGSGDTAKIAIAGLSVTFA